MLLEKATSLSTLAFLRIFHLSHTQVVNLVEDLKTHDLPTTNSRQPVTSTDGSKLPASVTISVSAMLDTALEELFATETQRYLERETKNLGELFSSYLTRFNAYHVILFL